MTSLPRLASALAVLTGCPGLYATNYGPTAQTPEPMASGAAAPGPTSGPPTALLSAQVLPPGAAEREYVLPVRAVVHLVFSRPIDPLTLVPQHFVVALADGRRVAPVGAFLAKGTGPAGQRSVALLLADGAAVAGAAAADPISVTITGLLHDVAGRVLEGLALDVPPRAQSVFAVRAEPASDPSCAGQALALFWSAPVRRPPSAPAPLVTRTDGSRGPAQLGEDAGAVLGLCAPGSAGVLSVEVPVGAFVDERGQAVTAGAVALSAPV